MFTFREAIELLRRVRPTSQDLRDAFEHIEDKGPRLFRQPTFVDAAMYVLIWELGLDEEFVRAELNRFVEDSVWNKLSRRD